MAGFDESASGGGFIKNEVPNSQAGAKAGGDRARGSKATAVVTVKMLRSLLTDKEGLVIYQQRFNNISIVGRVVTMETSGNKIMYTIQDTTGAPIEAQLWNNGNGTLESRLSNAAEIQIGSYIRIAGTVRKNNTGSDDFIIAYKVSAVTDPNEVVMHVIETYFNMKVLQKRKNNLLAKRPANEGFGSSTPAFLQGAPLNTSQSSYASGAGNAAAGGASDGMNKGHNAILKAITGSSSDQGVSLEEIASQVPFSKDQIAKALEFLSTEGHIYTTIDDDHYKATDA